MEIVQTGLYWLKDLSEEQIVAIKNAYSYPDPKEPTKVFYTFIEHNGKLGIPWGDRQKAIRVLGGAHNITDKRINTPFNNPCEFVGHALRDYQEEAFKEVESYFASGGSVFNLSGAPGSGKSFMLSYLLSKLKVRVLIIAHLSMLTNQLFQEASSALNADIRILDASNTELGDINIATSQFISRRPEIWKEIKKSIGLLVVDESESAASETTLRILQRSYAKYRIFISATFSRSVDERTEALTDLAGHKVISLERKDLLKPTVLGIECPEVFTAPQNPNFYKRAQTAFYRQYVSIDQKVLKIVIGSLKKGRQVLLVTDLIEQQEKYAAMLNAEGITTGILNGSTKASARKRILEEFDNENIKVLIGAAVLNAGISVPKIQVILRVSFPNSPEKLTQLIGRALRDFPGKQGAWFIDLQFRQGVFKREQLYRQAGFKYIKMPWAKFEQSLEG
jgi:superfamily II DNA or RNA helicase